MNKKRLRNMLCNYKKNKSKVEIKEGTIEMWKKALENPSSIAYLQATGTELGMPRARNNKSVVEKEVLKKEEDEQEAIVLVIEWIREEKSKIFHMKLEVMKVEKILEALNEKDRVLVELKFFGEKMTWGEIEIHYNKKVSSDNEYVSARTLQRRMDELTEIMLEILNF